MGSTQERPHPCIERRGVCRPHALFGIDRIDPLDTRDEMPGKIPGTAADVEHAAWHAPYESSQYVEGLRRIWGRWR